MLATAGEESIMCLLFTKKLKERRSPRMRFCNSQNCFALSD